MSPRKVAHSRVLDGRDQRRRRVSGAIVDDDQLEVGESLREHAAALLTIPTRHSFTLLMEAGTCAPAGAEVMQFASEGGGSAARPLGELMRLMWTISLAPLDAWFFPS